MVGSLILIFFLLFPTIGVRERNMNSGRVQSIGGMGVTTDNKSLIGRQEQVAIKMAIEDFTMSTGHNPSLHVRDSGAKSFRAASNALRLVQEDGVQAIIGAFTSEEVGSMAEIMDDHKTWRRFQRRLRPEDPDQHYEEEDILGRPGFCAFRAYDDAWTAAAALERKFTKNDDSLELLGETLRTNFTGLSGEIGYKEGRLSRKNRALFWVNNVIGNSYRGIGFWSPEHGYFSGDSELPISGEALGVVPWPGGSVQASRGWTPSGVDQKPLRIGVSATDAFAQFVKVRYDGSQNESYVTAFSVRVFEAVVKRLPYLLPYELVPFNGSYDDLVEQLYLKNFDAVLGDMEIMMNRYGYVDFAQPYTESGFGMEVTEKPEKLKKAWLFLQPITKSMWIFMVATNVFIGVAVWFIDRKLWRLIVIGCSFSAGALVVFYRRLFHYYSENWSQTWMASMDRKLWKLVMINLYKTHMKEKPCHQPRRSNWNKHHGNSAV